MIRISLSANYNVKVVLWGSETHDQLAALFVDVSL